MAEIVLTRGKVALVDVTDLSTLEAFSWYANPLGYDDKWRAAGYVHGRIQYMHRFILGAAKGQLVDHVNGNPLDNRRSNLRLASKVTNGQNAKIRRGRQYKGAVYDKRRDVWNAQIQVNKRMHYLGAHATQEAAARAYDKAALELFGDFAHLNFPR